MKKVVLTAALVVAAGAAYAGSMEPMAADPAPMVEMVEEPAGSGALGWIIPLVAVAAIALAADN